MMEPVEQTVEQRLAAIEALVTDMVPAVLALVDATTKQGEMNVQMAQGMVKLSMIINAVSEAVRPLIGAPVAGGQLPPPVGAAVRAPHPDGSGYL